MRSSSCRHAAATTMALLLMSGCSQPGAPSSAVETVTVPATASPGSTIASATSQVTDAASTPSVRGDDAVPGRGATSAPTGRLVNVPNVLGLPYEQAARQLERRGLRAVFRQVHETGPDGVLRQEPSARRLPRGATVTLVFGDNSDPTDPSDDDGNVPGAPVSTPASSPGTVSVSARPIPPASAPPLVPSTSAPAPEPLVRPATPDPAPTVTQHG